MSTAKQHYYLNRPNHGAASDDVYGFLSPCENCAHYDATYSCGESILENTEIILQGEDPDLLTGANDWANENISQQAVRTSVDHRWPYQIKTKGLGNTQAIKNLSEYGCSVTCSYLIRIQYKIFTSSRRRSYLQCGLSDIFTVERWNFNGTKILDHFNMASSVPFQWEQHSDSPKQFLKKDYIDNNGVDAPDGTGKPINLYYNSSASANPLFNPYGLREDYDPLKNKCEVHCGTLLFFAKGNDQIFFRLAQHTNINNNHDINPDNVKLNQGSRSRYKCQKRDMLTGVGDTGRSGGGTTGDNKAIYNKTKATFKVSALVRPVPGDLPELSRKTDSNGEEKNIKYAPFLY